MAKSEVAEHIHIESPGHQVDFSNIKVLDRDQNWLERGIREAIYIRALKPTLNRHKGRYTLPAVWDQVLKSHVQPSMGLVPPQ